MFKSTSKFLKALSVMSFVAAVSYAGVTLNSSASASLVDQIVASARGTTGTEDISFSLNGITVMNWGGISTTQSGSS